MPEITSYGTGPAARFDAQLKTCPCLTENVGFALWIDRDSELAWAQGTHEYRPMGTAVISRQDQFRPKDFRQTRRRPVHLEHAFAGFFGSLEELNVSLRSRERWRLVWTPAHLR